MSEDAGSGKKQRITITIGDEELSLAKASGEPVSSYIQRLIREDAESDAMRVPLPPGLGGLMESSGVLREGARQRLHEALHQVIVSHIDSTLMDSRAKLMAISDDAIAAALAKRR
jgi:hypothetical protein